ncbi:GNAT family N-acetyltransferase [Nonomuraea soli]|uniref:Lysine N-acyltransferase MbtK n=1 Tax=Nonomuraea soli TaxID=1032476 RepID=A0A7W0CSZ6_9ACTN|nr:GNAT family N-acetyltransferase [Nonomuraea soli]MBA2896766.1 penicillin amidase [Nonomuraea soli]
MTDEIFRDEWGIPSVRAAGFDELARAQGWVTARDRAWQLEVERHRSQGTSAAFLGPDHLPWDRFARQARIADTARRCFEALDEDTARWTGAYADGVNAGLEAQEAPEFARVGITPGRWEAWTPLAVWLSHHLLFTGLPGKLWRGEVERRLGPGAAPLFAADAPGSSGSNGWLIPGRLTASGAAIVAGDPHRHIENPGIYQQIRLSCPGVDVVGLAVPGVPGIAHFGHAGSVAWAITNAMADYQDLYRERLRERQGTIEALGPDGWRPASVHTETVEVAGAAPARVKIVETDRGPIVIGGQEPMSLRYPARVRHDLGFAALPRLLRAATVADVDRAFDLWAEPVNVVLAADDTGATLHRVAGAVPLRHDDNLLRPVPAWDEQHVWRGWHDSPRAEVTGITVMANEKGLAAPLGAEFAPPYRADRIRELLGDRDDWKPQEMAAIHMDTHLAAAAPLLDRLAALEDLDEERAALRDRLLAWDRRMDAGSTDAAAFAAVRSAVVRRIAAHPALAPLREPMPYPEVFLPWLDPVVRVAHGLTALLGSDLIADLPGLLREALGEPLPDHAWGHLHRLAPWQTLPGGDPWPGLSGDHDCVLATTSVPGLTDVCSRGPSARYVWDLARREDSRWIVPLGASGLGGDRHHRDQLPLWVSGDLIPVLEPARVYERLVDGFGAVRIRPVDPAADLDVLHAWVTQERARFWGMLEHARDDVLEIYEHLDGLPTHHAYLVERDGRPVALFQTYEPLHDPVGECYDVRPGDFGIHLMIGPPSGAPEPGYTGVLLSAFLDYVWAQPGRARLVAEPDARNQKAIDRLVRMGFEPAQEIDLGWKRARLLFMPRP